MQGGKVDNLLKLTRRGKTQKKKKRKLENKYKNRHVILDLNQSVCLNQTQRDMIDIVDFVVPVLCYSKIEFSIRLYRKSHEYTNA